ncbi:restriction endonuclease subunit S [Vibrio vulnificus]|nr:restriction endonuclease subunit S [Vibrio vulnificus]
MTEQMNVPKLRFGEYKDHVAKPKKLGQLVDMRSGNTPSKSNPKFWEGTIPWISASSMKGNVFSESEQNVTQLALENGAKLATKGSLLLLVRGSMLFNKIPIGFAGCDVTYNQDVKAINLKSGDDNSYLFHWFKASEYKLLSMVTGTGIGAGKLDSDELLSLPFHQPKPAEQQKIASFLSKVDEKIVLLTEKKAKLTEYKKGVMQQLFDGSFQEQDGKLVFVPPTLRFKADDGSEFPDWEEVSLGSITTAMQSGISRQLHSEDIGYPILRSNNLSEGKVSFEDLKYWHLTDDQGADLTRYILEEGDLLVNFINSLSQIGKVAIYYNSMGRDVIYTTNIMRLKFNSLITSEFAFYSFNTRRYVNFIQSIAKPAVSQASFTTVDFKKYKMHVPTRAEQNKMTSLLFAIDKKIELINTELEKAKEWKKGLLQQMFV